MVNPFPGNNRAAAIPLFNMLPECQWVIHSNTQSGRMEREDTVEETWVCVSVCIVGAVMYRPGQSVCTQIKEGNHD